MQTNKRTIICDQLIVVCDKFHGLIYSVRLRKEAKFLWLSTRDFVFFTMKQRVLSLPSEFPVTIKAFADHHPKPEASVAIIGLPGNQL